MKSLLLNITLLFALLGGFGSVNLPLQETAVEFRNPVEVGNFPEGITFRIEVCGRPASSRVVFHYAFTSEAIPSWGWTEETWTVDEGQTSDDCDLRKYDLDTKELEIPPFAPVQYYWSVEVDDKVSGSSSKYLYSYKNDSYDWQVHETPNIVLWWHDRPDTFAQDVMSIAAAAYDEQAQFYEMSLESPVTIVIVNSSDEFFAWQAEENYAGGMAFYDLYLTIQWVEPDDSYDWLNDVVPHEISHIFFNHLVKRYSGAPYWLDEGLATFLEYNDHSYEWEFVQDAVANDKILSLGDLQYTFGDNEDTIDLAYAQSYYAVLYLAEVYGRGAISSLLNEFRKGSGTGTGFEKALQKTPEQFESEFVIWLKERIKTPPPNTERRFEEYIFPEEPVSTAESVSAEEPVATEESISTEGPVSAEDVVSNKEEKRTVAILLGAVFCSLSCCAGVTLLTGGVVLWQMKKVRSVKR